MVVGQKKATDEKRDYKQIVDWESGCPECPAKASTYNTFKMHQSSKKCQNNRIPLDLLCLFYVLKKSNHHKQSQVCMKKASDVWD